MKFEITPEMYQEATLLKIEIRPSANKKRLIDLYRDDELLYSIGARNFLYFNQLVETQGIDFAIRKREKILHRFKNNCSPEVLYTLRLLWLC